MMATLKDLRLHTLRGDVQSCGMDGMSKKGISRLLKGQYVHLNSEIIEDEFYSTLEEEYKKVIAWQGRKGKGGK